METCTYGLGADIWKPTTERCQGVEYRAYVRQYWLRNKYLFGKRLGEDSNHLLPTDLSVGETRWGV